MKQVLAPVGHCRKKLADVFLTFVLYRVVGKDFLALDRKHDPEVHRPFEFQAVTMVTSPRELVSSSKKSHLTKRGKRCSESWLVDENFY